MVKPGRQGSGPPGRLGRTEATPPDRIRMQLKKGQCRVGVWMAWWWRMGVRARRE